MTVEQDTAEGYALNARYSEKFRRSLYFGGVRMGKNYVSYQLMPVYMFPALLKGISPDLKKRMQGKSCFNFTKFDEALFAELDELTQRGIERSRREGLH
jgi:hypothetical protein